MIATEVMSEIEISVETQELEAPSSVCLEFGGLAIGCASCPIVEMCSRRIMNNIQEVDVVAEDIFVELAVDSYAQGGQSIQEKTASVVVKDLEPEPPSSTPGPSVSERDSPEPIKPNVEQTYTAEKETEVVVDYLEELMDDSVNLVLARAFREVVEAPQVEQPKQARPIVSVLELTPEPKAGPSSEQPFRIVDISPQPKADESVTKDSSDNTGDIEDRDDEVDEWDLAYENSPESVEPDRLALEVDSTEKETDIIYKFESKNDTEESGGEEDYSSSSEVGVDIILTDVIDLENDESETVQALELYFVKSSQKNDEYYKNLTNFELLEKGYDIESIVEEAVLYGDDSVLLEFGGGSSVVGKQPYRFRVISILASRAIWLLLH